MKPVVRRLTSSSSPIVDLTDGQLKALREFRGQVRDSVYRFESVSSPCGVYPGDNESLLLASRDRFGLNVNTWLSRVSGLMWQSPRMTKESLDIFYKEIFQRLYRGPETSKSRYYATQITRGEHIIDFISRSLPDDSWKKKTVFDVGCGAGGVLEPFRERGCHVFGCDTGGEDFLEYGRIRGLTLEHGSISALNKYGKADLIILMHVLEHVPEPIEMLRNLGNALSPDGRLFVGVPGVTNLAVYGHDFLRYLQNSHLYHFTQNTLCDLGARAQLRAVAKDERVYMLFMKSKFDQVSDWDPAESDRILSYLNAKENYLARRKPIQFVRQIAARIVSRMR